MKRRDTTGPSGPTPRPGRPAAAPPALLRDPADSFAGVAVLDEFEPALGLALFQTVRSVLLWAAAAPDERPDLFTATALRARLRLLARAKPSPAVTRQLEELANLVLGKEKVADPRAVAAACSTLSTWAEEREALKTAVEFAQAAALARPRSAPLALRVGELLYRAGRNARAETWFRRTLTLARSTTDPNTYADASVDLAWVLVHDGRVAAARTHLIRAVRAARRAGLRSTHAQTLHALIRFALVTGDLAVAEPFVSAVTHLCDPGLPHGARVLLDLAWLRLAQRRPDEALALADSVATHVAVTGLHAEIAELRDAAAVVLRSYHTPPARA